VRHDCHRRGIGRSLLAELIAAGRRNGTRTILARIAADQPASEALHEAFGFRNIGCMHEVGYKFDRWLDVSMWQLMLTSAAR
jgi:phosphinothricin acetyltransferase